MSDEAAVPGDGLGARRAKGRAMTASGRPRLRKPAPPPATSAWGWVALVTSIVATGVAVGWWLAAGEDGREAPMRVEVTLDNRCELIDDAFIVVTEPDGARATFERGLAALQTRSGSRVYLKANDKYPGFEFESPRKVAQSKMVLTAECGTGERIERTIDAMREQFRSGERGSPTGNPR
jgi:hypothetical protein